MWMKNRLHVSMLIIGRPSDFLVSPETALSFYIVSVSYFCHMSHPYQIPPRHHFHTARETPEKPTVWNHVHSALPARMPSGTHSQPQGFRRCTARFAGMHWNTGGCKDYAGSPAKRVRRQNPGEKAFSGTFAAGGLPQVYRVIYGNVLGYRWLQRLGRFTCGGVC